MKDITINGKTNDIIVGNMKFVQSSDPNFNEPEDKGAITYGDLYIDHGFEGVKVPLENRTVMIMPKVIL